MKLNQPAGGTTTYPAQVRCMFCDCLLGLREGFTQPGMVTHGLGECCLDFAETWWCSINNPEVTVCGE